MRHEFRVRWADIQPQFERELLKQSSRMVKVASVLKRAGFVLDGTDQEGFAIYLRPDRPAKKARVN